MELAEKLKAIRIKEGLTQSELCEATGLSLSSYKKYELALRTEVSSVALLKLTNHERFKKYTLWLMTGDVAPACGQVSPV
ncbi:MULTISPECIES: helix-turn-helix domain-containing protein [Pseudomonas]|uniref:Repressor n=2 Tax=Pseudomonas TaxID=286 RepID=A0AAP7FP28_9PSED|nr:MULTISPECIES: helix-turn-helix domain-containing protein [Pseudomonas]AYN18779.1 XRE family transcriptional regulator [Pseudomonas monteilii]MBA6058378.1 helix-turn-helix transcriptional regulator [Pseudomonas juntendi]MBA6125278.1 helix-turn-helix transcriptional regulator [Pseudomonas juntendi]MCE0874078.1 helix-turn-helix domain-containing protein [Pseudomonas monteilii]MDD1988194.1 helix-turn-helix domain-containing protein [Pseudomonas putida]